MPIVQRLIGAGRRRAVLAAVVLAGGLWTVGAAQATTATTTTAAPACSSSMPGGDWPTYGHDLSNTRTQTSETGIGPAQASKLALAWATRVVFATPPTGDVGLNGTPSVADGCVFAGGSDGTFYALNANTGAVEWSAPGLGSPAQSGFGAILLGSSTVNNGLVYVLVNQAATGAPGIGPHAVALDEHTGKLVWTSAPVSTVPTAYTNASPQVSNALLFVGYSVGEGDPHKSGGFALLDAQSGQVLVATPTIPPADQAKGFAGGGIWSTPAFDSNGFAYVGAGNPASKRLEHLNTNAILKIDARPGSPSFGQIVGSYKGQVDQYELPALTKTPLCTLSEKTALNTFPLDDPACGQLDLDFGGAPSLFTVGGRTLVGDIQKSGYYHVADTATMAGVWKRPVGLPCAFCNADSAAVAGGSIFVVGTPGGIGFKLAQASGAIQAVMPVLDAVHYESVSVANGVVYTLDTLGFLDAFNAATGQLLLHRSTFLDTRSLAVGLSSAGVSIANHMVYVEAGNHVVAYRAA